MKSFVKYLFTLTLLSLIGVKALQAGIITVKQDGSGDYTTIQAGMNACVWNSGDTVLVWPGVYYENIEYNGKHITVASLYIMNQDKWYIYNTIIDGNQDGICVVMNGGQGSMSINGVTIRNGNSDKGGGLYINLSDAVVKNCIVENNYANSGGGVYITQTEVYFSGCTIRNNHGKYGGGGIFCTYNSQMNFDTLVKCNIYMNYGPYGCDLAKNFLAPSQLVYIDTLTVIHPDNHFIFSWDIDNCPVNDIELHVDHGYLQPVNQDLYVNPLSGDDSNNGTNISEPLKTIAFAQMLINSDSLNPHNIFLSNGIYSPSTNDEKLPLGTRSYISFFGENRDSTIIDADSLSSFFRTIGVMKKYTLQNITLQRGKGGIYIERNDYVSVKNIILKNSGLDEDYAVFVGYTGFFNAENISIINWKGARALECGNTEEENSKSIRIFGCSIINNIPSDNPINIGGEGGGIGIVGSYQSPYAYKGDIINLRVTNNLRIPDPLWGSGMVVGFLANQYCKVNLINSTIGHNVLRGSYGFGTNAHSGAELNIYNSILFGDSLRELSLGYPNITDIPSTCRVYYSDIEGGQNEVQNWNGINNLVWGQGNINSDPLWDTTAAIPYAIPAESPCRNTGTPMYSSGMQPPYIIQQNTMYSLVTPEYDTIPLPSTDLRGKPRIMEGRIDMGAYEYDPYTGTNEQKLPDDITLTSIYPNPFYQNVFVSLEIKKAGHLTVDVFDIQGHHITNLMDSNTTPSCCTITWDGKDDLGWDVKVGEYMLKVTLDGKTLPGGKMVRGKWRR